MISNGKGFKTKLKEIKKEENRNVLKEKIKKSSDGDWNVTRVAAENVAHLHPAMMPMV